MRSGFTRNLSEYSISQWGRFALLSASFLLSPSASANELTHFNSLSPWVEQEVSQIFHEVESDLGSISELGLATAVYVLTPAEEIYFSRLANVMAPLKPSAGDQLLSTQSIPMNTQLSAAVKSATVQTRSKVKKPVASPVARDQDLTCAPQQIPMLGHEGGILNGIWMTPEQKSGWVKVGSTGENRNAFHLFHSKNELCRRGLGIWSVEDPIALDMKSKPSAFGNIYGLMSADLQVEVFVKGAWKKSTALKPTKDINAQIPDMPNGYIFENLSPGLYPVKVEKINPKGESRIVYIPVSAATGTFIPLHSSTFINIAMALTVFDAASAALVQRTDVSVTQIGVSADNTKLQINENGEITKKLSALYPYAAYLDIQDGADGLLHRATVSLNKFSLVSLRESTLKRTQYIFDPKQVNAWIGQLQGGFADSTGLILGLVEKPHWDSLKISPLLPNAEPSERYYLDSKGNLDLQPLKRSAALLPALILVPNPGATWVHYRSAPSDPVASSASVVSGF